MKLLAVVKNPASITRYLAAAGELTEGAKPPLGGCRAARLVAGRRIGRAACSDDRRSVTRASAKPGLGPRRGPRQQERARSLALGHEAA